jgi:aldehyde dehydrogenase (NAD+)
MKEIIEKQRKFFNTGRSKNIQYRKGSLLKLKASVEDHEEEIIKALYDDLGKSAFEAYETEIGLVYEEIRFMLKNIDRFSKPKKVRTTLANFPSKNFIYREPYGVVLIMSPWNYPFQLTMIPLIGAIAAGNCSVIKPSNYSPNTSAIIYKIIEEAFEEEHVTVALGGREANKDLLESKFDYIFFTGGKVVGRVVMEKAAVNLTPVTLELGGKSPCIVEKTANINLAARRIVWGKFLNCGQTCVAPDYILVEESIKEELISQMIKYIVALYGENPIESKDYSKIINKKHYDRLKSLVEGEDLCYGGDFDDEKNKIGPCLLSNATWETKAMQEEIFGPILPIIGYNNLSEVKDQIISRPKPLALYLFTTDKRIERYIIKHISFGGGCINDTIMHLASSSLPFGGVGESGMGNYHGKYSLRTFSHEKSIVKKSNIIDVPLRYAPYCDNLWLIKKFLK